MLNYSITMRGNPQDKQALKKAYATSQYTEIMTMGEFAEHIASHGTTYKRADIHAVLMLAVDCLREQLIAGRRIELGDLGDFSLNISSEGALTAAEYNPDIHVKDVYTIWTPGERFLNLKQNVKFNLVASRKVARMVAAALKAGDTTIDLTDSNKTEDSGTDLEG